MCVCVCVCACVYYYDSENTCYCCIGLLIQKSKNVHAFFMLRLIFIYEKGISLANIRITEYEKTEALLLSLQSIFINSH